jgi:adenosine kinase
MAAILGMGNPLLDISANAGKELFDKYGLEAGGIILAEEKHQPLFAEMEAKPDKQYIAGGATQNSIRVAQWMLQTPGSTAYMGCVGKDAQAEQLRAACKADGVNAQYMEDPSTPTGCCACLILDKERSLCTNLAAANNYKADHVKSAEMWKIVEAAKIVYSAGFFITVSPESIEAVSNQTVKSGAIYCLNLSAPFISQVPPFRACLQKTLPNVDYLFGNETEARAYSEAVGWDSDNVEFIATRLSLIPMALKGGEPRKRKVVITQGMDPTIVAVNGNVTAHPTRIGNQGPISVPEEKIIDTNVAGDAFVGGFLAALSKGKDVADCCKAGNHAAAIIIQHSGCTYPASPNYTF